jgi:Leucine-rich repeat (LRR) protein
MDLKLANEDRVTLLDLYENFLLFDYINLCHDLKQIDEMKKQGDMPDYITNFAKVNSKGKTVLDIDRFLVLYKELQS